MRYNLTLHQAGEISHDELVRRNNDLMRSARRESEETLAEVRWIDQRYKNIATASWGTLWDGGRYWLGYDSNRGTP